MTGKFSSIADSLFRGKTDNTFFQLIRYTFVGGLAFLIDFGTLYTLTEFLRFHYLLSAGIAFLLGLLTNYFISTIWVFTSRSVKNKKLEFLIFAVIGLVGLGLNELFIWIFTSLLSIYYLLSKILTAILVYLWNFFVRKMILFKK
ncbi:MAG: GtrA family protein [Bacteroidia bacterium]|nr:GtrA family protein [Bacteroidia bacterium]